jgi:hypothetical protein
MTTSADMDAYDMITLRADAMRLPITACILAFTNWSSPGENAGSAARTRSARQVISHGKLVI